MRGQCVKCLEQFLALNRHSININYYYHQCWKFCKSWPSRTHNLLRKKAIVRGYVTRTFFFPYVILPTASGIYIHILISESRKYGRPQKFVAVQKCIDICSALPYRKPPSATTWLSPVRVDLSFTNTSSLSLLSPGPSLSNYFFPFAVLIPFGQVARQSLSLCVVTFLQCGQHQGRGWYLPKRSQGASDPVTLRGGVRRCHMGPRGRKMTIVVKIGTYLWRGSLNSSLCQYHPPRGTSLRAYVSWEDILTCPCSVLPLHHLPDPLEPLHDSGTVTVPVFLKVCSEEHQNPHESRFPGVAPQTFWGWSLRSIPYLWATSGDTDVIFGPCFEKHCTQSCAAREESCGCIFALSAPLLVYFFN